MILRRTLLAAGGLALAHRALALDLGTASGHYRKYDLDLRFRHAVALMQDNAEGALESPSQLRVVLSDTPVAAPALCGMIFPPVRALARAGQVRGLMLEFDPANREALLLTVLAPPEDPSFSLPNISMSNTTGLWSRLEIGDTRAVGELKPDDQQNVAVSFSSPIFRDPVQADLSGAQARASEPVRVLLARAEALARGDVEAAAAQSTASAGAQLRALPPEMVKMAMREVPVLVRQLKAPERVVIREQTAAVKVGGGWASLVRADGAWKATD